MRSPSKRCAEAPVDDDRSEAGDTLIEVLFAIVILGIAGVALMTGFATALTSTATQRELVNREASVRAVTAEAVADIQNASNNLFVNSANCATSTPVPPAFTNLPTNFTVSSSVLYWNGSSFASGGSNPQCQYAPQQWTLTGHGRHGHFNGHDRHLRSQRTDHGFVRHAGQIGLPSAHHLDPRLGHHQLGAQSATLGGSRGQLGQHRLQRRLIGDALHRVRGHGHRISRATAQARKTTASSRSGTAV